MVNFRRKRVPADGIWDIAYNAWVGSRTGRSLSSCQGMGEESPNSAEQCAG